MTILYVLVAVAIVLSVATLVAVFAMSKKKTEDTDSVDRLKKEIDKSITDTVRMENGMLTGAVNAQASATREMTERVDKFILNVDRKLDETKTEYLKKLDELKAENTANLVAIKEDNTKNLVTIKEDNARSLEEVRKATNLSLEAVRRDNAEQLEKMRQTVDEKLSSTLEQRFNQSFKIVNDRLEEINRTFGELQNLQTGVNDLNKIFKNVKTRGTWGEVALDNLLQQILVPEQYAKQVQLTRGSEDRVDFVIKMPGKGDGEVLLPIDAKFPYEDYARLVEASENGDADGVANASKALAQRIKHEAMTIRNKYVKPPKTTDFAIMYLPTESLYAEVIKREGLVEEIQNNYRIVVCGPMTIAALLNSLQMGFKSVAIEKRSAEIVKLMHGFTKEFEQFSDLLRKTGDKLGKVQDSLQETEKKTDRIRQRLGKVNAYVDENDKELNPIAEPVLIGNEDDNEG